MSMVLLLLSIRKSLSDRSIKGLTVDLSSPISSRWAHANRLMWLMLLALMMPLMQDASDAESLVIEQDAGVAAMVVTSSA